VPTISSAGLSRTNELANLDSSYTIVVCNVPPVPLQGSGDHHGPIPNNVHNDLLKRTPISSVQTMAQTDPITHHLGSNAQASTSGNYEADFARMRAELNKLLGTNLSQLGINPSKNRLYQRPYPDAFDLVLYPTGWHVPDFIKFSGDDNRSTWEHISQYVTQLGEASSSNSLRVWLFSLSLTGMAFSWFSALPPNSVRSWNELEQKFHDHFYSGDNQAKLTDLTSVKQTRDELVSKYFKRFKEVKNRGFNLSISDKDLVDVALNGLCSYLKENLKVLITLILMLYNFRQ
jgi:hypothetical protein